MYSIYADDVCIYSDVFALESMKVISPKLTLEDNAAGSLTMKLPQKNVGYGSIARMTTDISVQKDGVEIWAGRVLSESMDFYNNRKMHGSLKHMAPTAFSAWVKTLEDASDFYRLV